MYQPRQFKRPGKKTNKHGYKIKRQKQQIRSEQTGAMAFHCGQRTANDVSSNSNGKKFAVRLNQRRNSPQRYHDEREQNSADKFEAPEQLVISPVNDYGSHGQKRCPGNWPLSQKTQSEGKIEDEPPAQRCPM